jgi:hypothetical protein
MNAAGVHLNTALLALELGFSPLPPKDDGSKAPLADVLDEETGQHTWKPYQTIPATLDHVREWYGNGRTGVGLVGGYGGLDPFEFDCRDTYERFLEAAVEMGLGELVDRVRTGYEEFTPGGGVHWLFRCPVPLPPTKIAQRPAPTQKAPHARKTLIETKGVGGFIIIAPSNGKVHETGGAYKLVSGGLGLMTTLSPDERDLFWELARSFDEMPSEDHPDPFEQTYTKGGDEFPTVGLKVGDDLEHRMTWESILSGWVKVSTRGNAVCWRRPGKEKGISATTGHCKGLKVFTTSTEFATAGTYTKFGAYVRIHNKGDFTAAVKDLASKGYGTWIDDDGKHRQNPVSKEWFEKRKTGKQSGAQSSSAAAPVAEADVDWDSMSDEDMGILSADKIDPKPVEWLVPARIAKKKMNIVAGEGKKGKTQLVLALAALTSNGGELPDGSGRVAKGTVIILSAEDDPEDTLAPRLIALGADMSKIKIIKSDYIIRRKGKEPAINPIDFQRIPYWRALFRRFPDLQLFIADPVPSFLGRGVNDHKNADLRNILTPFLCVVRDFNVAMIAITHLIKGFDPKRPASYRISGSIAYANLARSIHFVATSPDDPAKRLFMMAENTSAPNDLPAWVFVLEPHKVTTKTWDVFEIWVSRFETEGLEVDVNEVVNSDVKTRRPPGRPPKEASITLAKWVLDYLRKAGSPVRLGDVYNAAGDAGFLGEYGPDKSGKIRWSTGYQLPRACARVAKLEGPDAGWTIDELEEAGRRYLQSLCILATPHKERPQDVPF